jgi:hypothetical protein
VPFLLAEQKREWSLMIFCARATRGRGLPSRGLMARHGKSIAKQSEGGVGEKYLPVGGRVRKLHAVGDQSSPPSREKIEVVVAWNKSASRRARGWAGENVACSQGHFGHSFR